MKIRTKVLIGLLLSFSVVFTGVGYAALTDELTIEGQLAFVIPDWDEVVIIDVKDANGQRVTWIPPTTVDSTVNLGAGESVTYTITVKNYSERIKYQYSEIVKDDTVANNALLGNGITVTTKFPNGEAVEPGAEMTFTATYTVTSADHANTDIHTLLNYKFGVHVDSAGDLAVDNALKQYEKILNNTDQYNTLTKQMGNNTAASGIYIGNVVGSTADDTDLIETLFGDNLTVEIDGTTKNVTCMIKQEKINGKTSMTLYLTPDTITGSGSITVYAAVFFQENGDWKQAGDLYTGTANKNNYEGSLLGTRNSFNTDTWCTSQQEYKVCDASSYTINGTTYNIDAYSYEIEEGTRNRWGIVQSGSIDDVIEETARTDAWAVFGQMRDVASAVLDSNIYSESSNAIVALKAIKQEADAMYTAGQTNTTQAELTMLMKEFSHILRSFADEQA